MIEEYLLNRSHRQYTEIDEFKNYELINCVIYEMAVRNSDILVLTLLCNVLSKNISLSKELKKFINNNKNKFDFLNNKKNIFEYEYEYEMDIQKKLENDYFFYTESHDNWIYCYNFSPVYNPKIIFFSQLTNGFESSSHYSNGKYYFHRKVNEGFVIESTLGFIPMVKPEVINDLNNIDYLIHEVKHSIECCFSRPIIKASKNLSKIVSLEYVNLALPEKELISYILHLKKEFNKDSSIIPTPNEITSGKHYFTEDINNFTATDWSDCFFIYDYYKKSTFSINETAKYLQEIFNAYHGIKINKLKSELKKGKSITKVIPYDFYINNKEKFLKQNRIANDYYSISTIKSRYRLMISLIDKLGYKTLIGG